MPSATAVATSVPFDKTTAGAKNMSGTSVQGALEELNPKATYTLYVDGGRVDSYTADGTVARPFKTIQAAVNQVISNGDNSTSLAYRIVLGAFSYSETVDIGSSAIVNIAFDGLGAATVTGFQSLANNVSQGVVGFLNMNIGTLNLSCPTNNASPGLGYNNIYTFSCSITGNITLANIQNIFFNNSQALGVVSATNVNFGGWVDGVGLKSSGSLALITNNGLPVPSGFAGTFWICESSQNNGSTTIDVGSTFVADVGAMIATSSAKTITVNGLYRSIASITRASIIVNSGGTYRAEGGASHTGTLTVNAGGAYTQTGHYGIAAIEVGGAQESTNAVVTYKDGHLRSTQTTAPTTTTNANAGTGASSSVANATDSAGTVNITTGTLATASGVQATVNFNKAYNVAPLVVLTPANAATAAAAVAKQVYVTSTVNGFSVNFGVAEVAGTAYSWTYHAIETQ